MQEVVHRRQALFAPLVPIAPLHAEEVVDIDKVLWGVTSRTLYT